MGMLLFVAAVGILPLALLFVPRKAFAPTVAFSGLLSLLAIVWTLKLGMTCSSDGCIGAGMAAGISGIFVTLIVIAGGVRWLIIRKRGNGANS
jgi:heme/copper-type cytochrome/quinol oxidase subunit 4